MAEKPVLYGAPGCGSAVVEAAFILAGEDYDYVLAEPWTPSAGVEALKAVNPLVQVPTLVLADGTVMTESVAILLWLMDRHPGLLGPGPDDPLRGAFLRWLVYLPAAIYPMYTVGDFCDRWVTGEKAAAELKQATIDRTLFCWGTMEAALKPAAGSWLLGTKDLTALDLYISMMTRWRPRREEIRKVAPGIVAAAERVDRDPRLVDLWRRHFPDSYTDP
ncbi:glutathione S-transferase [Niveispirillum sp. KHB5.9]|uniref:glutathione S-transferase n=1 Tax=Niveispirillum sp. KHB5.9 TaxID=3400269 RepID=UPI003A89FC1A